jgi:hypothetical protein
LARRLVDAVINVTKQEVRDLPPFDAKHPNRQTLRVSNEE